MRAEFGKRGFEVAGVIIDRHVGAELAAELHFFVAAGGGDDFSADGPGHLNHGRSDAARAAVDEHFFAHLQIGDAEAAPDAR